MILGKTELIQKYFEERKNKVGNFDLKVQTSTLLMKFFSDRQYNFYFCPKIKPTDTTKTKFKTPDFQISKLNKVDIIGEIKQSLPNPIGEDYDKKAIGDINQLKDYKGDLMTISTPHDVFFSAPNWCNDAIANYMQRIDNDPALKDKIIILKYYWMKGDTYNRLSISKVYGSFTDSALNEEFKFGKEYQSGEGDLAKIQGGYKILYTEEEQNGSPIEYIMAVIWHNIIPELINSSSFDRTLERIKKGENTLEFTIDEIMEVLDKIYVLKSSQTESHKQFSRSMIIDAMNCFEKIKKAQKLTDSPTNPKYRIIHSKIAPQKSSLIEYLIKELNKEEFENKANIEYQKSIHSEIKFEEKVEPSSKD